MLAQQYRAFKSELDAHGIVFSFSGYLSEGILYSLGDALRQKMALEDTDVTTIKKVFSVFVEQSQNIIRYSAEKVQGNLGKSVELSSGMVTIGSENGRFFIVCGNIILEQDMEKLRGRLETLRGMDRDAIKAYYKEQLREPPDEGSRGATIGLIEIARRASAPIEFDFDRIDADRHFFCLKVSI
ncbi:SiaB family protein kinase [Magnetospirillum sulfuroxidans]|uniref:SiaB family protein kinase n=1 Tax=Magnetospirillum sulfuroxidans TaxID=611300 RepID=A0ABS5IHK7_9PROT|nr:SiaB family protein kinase [Magnetospirillum sulfuroxidans]MBR9973188.1 SiaB family protein kinase [Magnetospirillum sulfuroxidans]